MRRTTWVLLALVALALALRAWDLDRVGLDHFDEGVYAASARSIGEPSAGTGLAPLQELFSPPAYFGAVGALQRATGLATDVSAVLLNVVLGALTVAALGWIGRAWFGAAAGAAAAALLAFSEFHVALSRCGLTDVAFALLLLLAVYALVEAVRRRSFALALAAGLVDGLAWNTKYHGWLAFVVAGAALAWEWLATRRFGPRELCVLATAALVAALCYLPWFLHVESLPGGYAALAGYQRSMLRGDVLANAWKQLQFQLYFEGPLSRASVPLALAAAVLVDGHGVSLRGRRLAEFALLTISSLVLGAALTIGALAVLGLLQRSRALDLRSRTLAAWLLAWAVLTPLYQPYARLLLPWSVAACLGCGAWLQAWLERGRDEHGVRGTTWFAAACALGVLLLAQLIPAASDPWCRSRGMRDAVEAMLPSIPAGSRVLVIGDPSAAFYLQVAGRRAHERVDAPQLPEALEAAQGPVFVVTTIYTRMRGAEQELLQRFGERLRPLGNFAVADVKDLRLLDDFAPRRAFALHAHSRSDPLPQYDLKLYRFDPAPRAR